MTTRHASLSDIGATLCGGADGKLTRPKESVNCPGCRTALNFLNARYPERFGFIDIRPTKEESREAAADMARDMRGD